MSPRRTRSGGASQLSGSKTTSPTKSLRKSQRKSGSNLPKTLPEMWQTPQAAPVRKPIVLKKIVAHAVEIPGSPLVRRSPRIAFFLEKENNPPNQETTKTDLFTINSVPMTPNTTPVLSNLNVIRSDHQEELDARDVEMSKKVRRSYSRLQSPGSTSTSTPDRQSCFGFEGLEDLPRVSPVPYRDSGRPFSGHRVPPVEQKPEEFQVSEESNVEPSSVEPMPDVQPEPTVTWPSSVEPMPDVQPEPTVTFLFTLLNTPQPKDNDSESDIQENLFLGQEDWGPKRTLKEMRHLQNECMRLRDAVSTIQLENLSLREKLQNLSTTFYYQSIKQEVLACQVEAEMTPVEETE
ncbi:sororin isoform 2-T2 [Thomomys bottae]